MKRPDRPVAIIGAGTMGHGIAELIARCGFEVRLQDEDVQALGTAKVRIGTTLDKALARGTVTHDQKEQVLARIRLVDTIEEAVDGCRIAIEAVPEDPAIKEPVFRLLDRLAPSTALLASNTSAISITLIASWTEHRDRVVGLHFFNPPGRMPLVEVVRGLTTSDRAVEQATRFCEQIGKETIVVSDRPGFATSRLSAALGNEAWFMLMEGVASAQEIDKGVKLALGHPMGPFELGDLIGLDVRLSVLRYLHRTLGDRFRPCPLLVQYVEAGYLGRKTGRGVYEYHDAHRAQDD